MTTQAYEQLILEGIKGLPDATLAEIADFVYFLRRKVLQPQAVQDERQSLLLRSELKQLSRDEEAHLEKEFKDYDQLYPGSEFVSDTMTKESPRSDSGGL